MANQWKIFCEFNPHILLSGFILHPCVNLLITSIPQFCSGCQITSDSNVLVDVACHIGLLTPHLHAYMEIVDMTYHFNTSFHLSSMYVS